MAFEEANSPEFKLYAEQVVENARILVDVLKKQGMRVFGSENHLMVVDVGTGRGREVAILLEQAGIVVNANTIPHDVNGPFKPSGIRLGTPALTTRGMGVQEMEIVGGWIAEAINNPDSVSRIKQEVEKLCDGFPILE